MTGGGFIFDKRLDAAYLESIYEGDKEYAAVVFEQFLLDFPIQWKAAEGSYAQKDITSYKAAIHKVKAAFSFVGLTQLTAQAEILEKECAEHGDTATLSGLHQEFKKNTDMLLPIVAEELKRLQS
jgi:HPt (histidine-containing phosphotransfer) domain-containing protein